MREAIPEDEFLQMVEENPRRGHGPWSHHELLLAQIADLLKWVIFATFAAQGAKPEEPEPLARPGVKTKSNAPDPAAIAYLMALRQRHAEMHGPARTMRG